MRFKKKIYILLALSMLLIGTTGCSSDDKQHTSAGAGLDKLGTITVVSREEGSGTREVFAESIGFYDSATGRDLTKSGATFSMNSEEVIDIVEKDKSAIGYVSKGVLANADGSAIHEVTIDGNRLERSFYLAYSGKMSELERDFMTYVKGAGQEIVKRNYTNIKKSTSFLSSKPSGTIKIGGSSSVSGLMQELVDDYRRNNPNAVIEVVVTDSTNGLTGAMSGLFDLGMSSRDLKDYEKELLEYEVIAKDEIALIVHAENPLENISSKDLKSIYTGDITDWKGLINGK